MSVASNAIKESLDMATFCVNAYLGDLSNEDLFVRPSVGTNHIAWQLGHLISSENKLIESVCPGSMPRLPEGFSEKYTSETSKSDSPGDFHTKEEYIKLMREQRSCTLASLAESTDDDLQKPAPEMVRDFAPTVGATFTLQGIHWMMHSGQWVVVRRKLGRTPLF